MNFENFRQSWKFLACRLYSSFEWRGLKLNGPFVSSSYFNVLHACLSFSVLKLEFDFFFLKLTGLSQEPMDQY